MPIKFFLNKKFLHSNTPPEPIINSNLLQSMALWEEGVEKSTNISPICEKSNLKSYSFKSTINPNFLGYIKNHLVTKWIKFKEYCGFNNDSNGLDFVNISSFSHEKKLLELEIKNLRKLVKKLEKENNILELPFKKNLLTDLENKEKKMIIKIENYVDELNSLPEIIENVKKSLDEIKADSLSQLSYEIPVVKELNSFMEQLNTTNIDMTKSIIRDEVEKINNSQLNSSNSGSNKILDHIYLLQQLLAADKDKFSDELNSLKMLYKTLAKFYEEEVIILQTKKIPKLQSSLHSLESRQANLEKLYKSIFDLNRLNYG